MTAYIEKPSKNRKRKTVLPRLFWGLDGRPRIADRFGCRIAPKLAFALLSPPMRRATGFREAVNG
jgi:hypothetical protein